GGVVCALELIYDTSIVERCGWLFGAARAGLNSRGAPADYAIRYPAFCARTLPPFFRHRGHTHVDGHHRHSCPCGHGNEYGARSHITSITFISARAEGTSYEAGSVSL